MDDVRLLLGDCREVLRGLPAESVHVCVTSPPFYGLRDYGVADQIGLEETPAAYVATLVGVFREVRRVLRPDGTLWLNLGDSYAGGKTGRADADFNERTRERYGKWSGSGRYAEEQGFSQRPVPSGLKPKDLIGIPWRVAFALQADGWYLRMDCIWHKPNPMPESVRDRPTRAHEYLFLLAKSERYYYNAVSVREGNTAGTLKRLASGPVQPKGRGPKNRAVRQDRGGAYAVPVGRNRHSVWTVATKPFKGAHFATFPEKLIEPCVLAGCPAGGTVLDPFGGACTTGLVAWRHWRRFVGIELNPAYLDMGRQRLAAARAAYPLFAPEAAS